MIKTQYLRIVNGERKYYRQHIFDTLTHEADKSYKIGKTQTDLISSTQFPKDKYHEIIHKYLNIQLVILSHFTFVMIRMYIE